MALVQRRSSSRRNYPVEMAVIYLNPDIWLFCVSALLGLLMLDRNLLRKGVTNRPRLSSLLQISQINPSKLQPGGGRNEVGKGVNLPSPYFFSPLYFKYTIKLYPRTGPSSSPYSQHFLFTSPSLRFPLFLKTPSFFGPFIPPPHFVPSPPSTRYQ